jgi:hypothetical protein
MLTRKKLFLLLLFSSGYEKSQDVITRTNGNSIICQVRSVDSAAIHYSINSKGVIYEIARSEVESYHIAEKAQPKEQTHDTVINAPLLDASKSRDLIQIRIDGGYSIPVGAFGHSDLERESSGMATWGMMFQGIISAHLSKNFGISAGYRYQTNRFDDRALEAQSPPGVFSLKSMPWKINGFYGGLNFYLPLNNFFLEAAGMVSYAKYTSPHLTRVRYYGWGRETITQYESNSYAFTCLGSLAVHYKFRKDFAVHLGADFLKSKPSFSDVLVIVNNYPLHFYLEQKITTVTVNAGFNYIIQKSKRPVK